MNKQHLSVLPVLLLAALVSACGSDGDDDHDHVHDTVTKTYSFYLNDAGNVFAVDPSAASPSPIEVTDGTNSLVVADADADGEKDAYFIQHGTYTSGTDTISDIHYPWLIVLSNKVLYKINAVVSAGTPVATQFGDISGISDINGIKICSSDYVTDFASSSSSIFLFKSVIGGDVCANSAWHHLALSATSASAPSDIKKIISGRYDSTGALTGYLGKNPSGGNLSTTDTTFSTYTNVLDTASALIPIGSPKKPVPNRTGITLFLDDKFSGGGTGQLYAFNQSTSSITSTGILHTITTADWTDNSKDETYLFFDDGNDIIRVNRDGSATSTVLVTGVTGGVTKLGQTDSHLVFLNGSGVLYRIAKTSTSVAEAATTQISTNVNDFFTNGSKIFYNALGVAHYVDETSSIASDGNFPADFTGNATGTAWIAVTESSTRSDELVKEKEDMILFAESSDTENSFYKVDSTTLTKSAAALTIPASIDITDAAQFGSDDRESDYFLLSVLTGATSGDAVYAVNAHDATSVRVDDSATTNDDAAVILSPR